MGSPFPGMDPYLEGDLWQEFHQTLANAVRNQLLPNLAPKYVALLSRRFVIMRPTLGISYETAGRSVYPDVGIQRIYEGVVPYATAPDLVIEGGSLEEVPVLSVEIRDVRHRELVTAIEIMSPANKFEPGWSEYRVKRDYLLATRVNVIELDLLRRGQRVPLARPLPPDPYCVIVNRHERRANEVWLLPLRDRLKVIPVPLRANDADVPLDLQAAVDACFATVGYERLLAYDEPPPAPAFSPEDQAWLEARLQAAGYRERP